MPSRTNLSNDSYRIIWNEWTVAGLDTMTNVKRSLTGRLSGPAQKAVGQRRLSGPLQTTVENKIRTRTEFWKLYINGPVVRDNNVV